MTAKEIIQQLKSQANAKNVAGMARFGMHGKNVLGVNVPVLRKMAKEIKKEKARPQRLSVSDGGRGDNHQLAQELWQSEIHEARILAGMIDEPEKVTSAQMESWVKDFESWGLCDQVCMNLFDKTKFAYDKAKEWSKRDDEFVKRAGFALMACLAWHDKTASDGKLAQFFPAIIREATDERNFVKKAVNWALRQIGKRNPRLRRKAIATAEDILKNDNKTSHWIAKDALRELRR